MFCEGAATLLRNKRWWWWKVAKKKLVHISLPLLKCAFKVSIYGAWRSISQRWVVVERRKGRGVVAAEWGRDIFAEKASSEAMGNKFWKKGRGVNN